MTTEQERVQDLSDGLEDLKDTVRRVESDLLNTIDGLERELHATQDDLKRDIWNEESDREREDTALGGRIDRAERGF